MSAHKQVESGATALCPVEEYRPTDAALATLAESYRGVVYDVRATNGMQAAKEARATLRRYRVDLEAERVRIKAPALERCRLIDAEAKRITAALVSLEDPIDVQIKTEEARKAAEREAKEKAERDRVAGIQARIRWFTDQVASAARVTTARDVEAIIGQVEVVAVDDRTFAEFTAGADDAKRGALQELRAMEQAAAVREAEAARLKAEREALEQERTRLEADRIAAEREQRERLDREAAERERIETAEREKRLAQEKAEREERERVEAAAAAERRAAMEAEQQRIAAERAELDRQRAQQEREAAERRQAEAAAQEAKQSAERAQRIATVTLVDAAFNAVVWMRANGYAEKEECVALDAALSRHGGMK